MFPDSFTEEEFGIWMRKVCMKMVFKANLCFSPMSDNKKEIFARGQWLCSFTVWLMVGYI